MACPSSRSDPSRKEVWGELLEAQGTELQHSAASGTHQTGVVSVKLALRPDPAPQVAFPITHLPGNVSTGEQVGWTPRPPHLQTSLGTLGGHVEGPTPGNILPTKAPGIPLPQVEFPTNSQLRAPFPAPACPFLLHWPHPDLCNVLWSLR